jgi:hypothetical protein
MAARISPSSTAALQYPRDIVASEYVASVPRRTNDFQELITLLTQIIGKDVATPSVELQQGPWGTQTRGRYLRRGRGVGTQGSYRDRVQRVGQSTQIGRMG